VTGDKEEVITVDASIAACAVEWRPCYYDVTQAPLHYVHKQTDGQEIWANAHEMRESL